MKRADLILALQNSGYSDDDAEAIADERELMDEDECQLCGEPADAEMSMYGGALDMVWAHAQCGVDEGLQQS